MNIECIMIYLLYFNYTHIESQTDKNHNQLFKIPPQANESGFA